jgi:hypothetical protein
MLYGKIQVILYSLQNLHCEALTQNNIMDFSSCSIEGHPKGTDVLCNRVGDRSGIRKTVET